MIPDDGVSCEVFKSMTFTLAYLKLAWRVPPKFGGGLLSHYLDLESNNGQFDVYFCSTSCMRAWINSEFDELERIVDRFLSEPENQLEIEEYRGID